MTWNDQIFIYCERGSDGGFWAEPFNALSNGAFLLAALAAGCELSRNGARNPLAAWLFVLLVAVIGVGSFLFHTLATRWAALADVMPIGVFVVAYLAFALRAFLGLGWLWVAGGLAAFVAAWRGIGTLPCRGLDHIGALAVGPCLNGTLAYAPAFAALLATGAALAASRHRAARYVCWAAAVFLVSMAFRTLDHAMCNETMTFGRPMGTHAFWHLLNATTLYLLLLAVIRERGSPEPDCLAREARA